MGHNPKTLTYQPSSAVNAPSFCNPNHFLYALKQVIWFQMLLKNSRKKKMQEFSCCTDPKYLWFMRVAKHAGYYYFFAANMHFNLFLQ